MLFWLVSVISLFLVSFYPTLFLTLTAVYDADRTWWLLGSIFILIFSPPVISYLASSEQLPGPDRQEPCQGRHWECRSSYSRSGAGQWPAENIIIVTVSTGLEYPSHFANIFYDVQKCQYCEQAKCTHQSPILLFFLLLPPIYNILISNELSLSTFQNFLSMALLQHLYVFDFIQYRGN